MDLDAEVRGIQTASRLHAPGRCPVIFTTIAFEPNLRDAGIWLQKLAAVEPFVLGTALVEIDPRLERRDDEALIVR
jgi:hypothetical protein